MAPRKPNHRVHPCVASRRRAILKKLLTCTPKGPSLPFRTSGLFRIYFHKLIFGNKKCEHEARSYTCHSPRTVLATASIFAMLVLYQLLLKCTKCQYGELTVSLLFSAQENTRHAHSASVSRNLNANCSLNNRNLFYKYIQPHSFTNAKKQNTENTPK